jgi:hypothetical protein
MKKVMTVALLMLTLGTYAQNKVKSEMKEDCC